MNNNTTREIRLEGDLTIAYAEATKALLGEHLGGDLCIDLSAVEEIDTAGLQLLILAKRETDAGGGTLRFKDPSAPVIDLVTLAGLAPYLDIPLATQ